MRKSSTASPALTRGPVHRALLRSCRVSARDDTGTDSESFETHRVKSMRAQKYPVASSYMCERRSPRHIAAHCADSGSMDISTECSSPNRVARALRVSRRAEQRSRPARRGEQLGRSLNPSTCRKSCRVQHGHAQCCAFTSATLRQVLRCLPCPPPPPPNRRVSSSSEGLEHFEP